MTEDPQVDRYGFAAPNLVSLGNLSRDNARLEKWEDMLLRWEYNITRRADFLKKRIRKGVPDCLRGRVWSELAEIEKFRTQYAKDYYKNLSETECESIAVRDILLDINRTFPGHVLFKSNGDGQKSLFRVLKAFSLHDPELGYCQGMGFVTALFLMYMNEEDAFWLLEALMKKYNMRDFYMVGMPGIYKAFYKINSLFKNYLPTLWRHFIGLNIYPSLFASSWLMTLYVNAFPMDVALRILDIFFNEGPKIIFRVYLSVFKNTKDELLRLDCDGILDRIRTIPDSLIPDSVIKNTFKISLSRKKLKFLEEEYENSPNSEFMNW
ncbi:unnamed protein product [Blepharisma stoltei]|uniref:Rab-GAP TBC domain-containing protein n=1 Tax=Blepharisma stoltei TaxID=1481888 RepID=A0AAU9J9E7_9CILI|nr:unnamed protein product [Blepharisma stoltei]